MIHDRMAALIFRGLSFIVIFWGLSSHIGLFSGTLSPGIFMYYTVQSNILALVLFGMLIVRTAGRYRSLGRVGKTGYMARFEMVCVVDLMLTLVVYWSMLAPGEFSSDGGLFTFDNLAVHLITPLLCLADYILFTDSGHLKYRDTFAILIFPYFYIAFSSFMGLSGYVYYTSGADGLPVHFPYFFIDFERIGSSVWGYVLTLSAAFLIISHVAYYLDKKIQKPFILPSKMPVETAGWLE